jgi:hypothetical protein
MTVVVPSAGGDFVTGSAQVSAFMAFQTGRVKDVRDSAQIPVEALVKVAVASRARLDSGGAAFVDRSHSGMLR